MIPYFFVFAISLLLFFVFELALVRTKRFDWLTILALITPISLFNVLFAGTIGSDLPHYTNQYDFAYDFILEPGFSLLMISAKLIGFDYFLFTKLLALIHLSLLLYILINLKDPLIFFLLYLSLFYLNFHFNAIRNSLALLIFAAFYIRTKKFNIYSLALSTAIHYSSVITFLIHKFSLYFNSKIRITLFIVVFIASIYLFNEFEILFHEYFYYSAYLSRVEVTKSIYPALIIKMSVVWILCKNGCSFFYFFAYSILVGFVHFVTPDANRICDLVLFLSVLETLSAHQLLKFRSSTILLSLILIFSSLLIPFNDCSDNSIDNWCIN